MNNSAIKGTIKAVCLSEQKGVAKRNVEAAFIKKCHGVEGDAHAGNWHRQVSFLSFDKIKAFRARGGKIAFGDFGENIVASGIDFASHPVGTLLASGSARFVITQIGKECHSRCAIYNTVGDCIMPREGVFAVVISSGTVKNGDELYVVETE